MKLSEDAEALLQHLWRCHQYNPVNHFEYAPAEDGGEIVHPASRRRLQTEPAVLDELIRIGFLRGHTHLSLTFDGIQYCQDRRRPRRARRRWWKNR